MYTSRGATLVKCNKSAFRFSRVAAAEFLPLALFTSRSLPYRHLRVDLPLVFGSLCTVSDASLSLCLASFALSSHIESWSDWEVDIFFPSIHYRVGSGVDFELKSALKCVDEFGACQVNGLIIMAISWMSVLQEFSICLSEGLLFR